jgi:hypothetical protein
MALPVRERNQCTAERSLRRYPSLPNVSPPAHQPLALCATHQAALHQLGAFSFAVRFANKHAESVSTEVLS